jgi:hypothetical protein
MISRQLIFCAMCSGAAMASPQANAQSDEREATPGEAESRKNLQQIVLALHNYHEEHGSLPPAALRDQDGRALLSWRVLILPHLGEQKLYDQFALDQPWDSPVNAPLVSQMPRYFDVPLEEPLQPGQTSYLVPVHFSTAFPPDGTTRFADIGDGLSNTIAVVEADRKLAVPWTKPGDLDYDPKRPRNGIGQLREDGCLVGWLNGKVTILPNILGSDQADPAGFIDALFGRYEGKGVTYLLGLE